jgi:hypothetical protein
MQFMKHNPFAFFAIPFFFSFVLAGCQKKTTSHGISADFSQREIGSDRFTE